eukprot:8585311-Prorocentrum_lima.AAC.1
MAKLRHKVARVHKTLKMLCHRSSARPDGRGTFGHGTGTRTLFPFARARMSQPRCTSERLPAAVTP